MYIHTFLYPPGIKHLHAYTPPVLDAKHHADAPSDSLHGADYHRPKFSKIVAGLVNVYIAIEHCPVEIVDLPSYKMGGFSGG